MQIGKLKQPRQADQHQGLDGDEKAAWSVMCEVHCNLLDKEEEKKHLVCCSDMDHNTYQLLQNSHQLAKITREGFNKHTKWVINNNSIYLQ